MDQSYAASVANNATKTGQDAINSFDPTSNENNYLASYNNLNSQQQGQTQSYAQQYAQAVANNPTVTSLYNQANDKYNVLGLQNTSNQLNNAVLTDPQNNVNAAKGFNYDAGQVSQQTNQDLARLSPLAVAAQNNAQTAQTNANAYVTAGQAQNAQNLLPVQSEQQFYFQQQANQAQAYITANSDTMQALTAKVNAGVQLSATEMQQYQSLLSAQSAVQSAQIGANAGITEAQLNNQYQTTPQGSTLSNTFANSIVNPGILAANGTYQG